MADGTVSNLDIRDIDPRGIDFKNLLKKTGETITGASFTVTNDDEAGAVANGLVTVSNSLVIAGSQCSVTLQASAYGNYILTCEAETSFGRRLNRSVSLSVEDR